MNYKLTKSIGKHSGLGLLASFLVLGSLPTSVEAAVAGNGKSVPALAFTVQQATVSGTVTSSGDNSALSGVTVSVRGTARGTTTDDDGRFSLSVSPGETLVFSYIGFVSSTLVVGNQTTLNVTLEPELESLDEVVVVGYGTQTRREVTSAVASVRAEDFNSGGARNPMDLIQGKVAGLTITRTGGNNPNSSVAVQLRGVTSLTGTTTPLIVVDGIPGGNLDLIQQADIESFDVLKDGSAAAIYGTRGNAGVILITTKKGRAGEARFDYTTYAQREVVDRKPEFLSASEFRDLISQGVINSSQDFGSSTDLYEELIDPQNLSHYHSLAASGGTANTNYRASIYYNEMNGIAKRNDRELFGGRLNVNQTGLQDRLTLSANLAANFNKADLLGGGGGDFEQAIQRNPTAPIFNEDGTFYETQNYNNYNPLGRFAHRLSERDQQTLSGDARLELKIIDGLTAAAFGSYMLNNWNDRYYRSSQDWDQRPASNWRGMGYASKQNEK